MGKIKKIWSVVLHYQSATDKEKDFQGGSVVHVQRGEVGQMCPDDAVGLDMCVRA